MEEKTLKQFEGILPKLILDAQKEGLSPNDKFAQEFCDVVVQTRPEFALELVKVGIKIGAMGKISGARETNIIPAPLMVSMQRSSIRKDNNEIGRAEKALLDNGLDENLVSVLAKDYPAIVVTLAENRPEVNYTKFMELDLDRSTTAKEVYANLESLKKQSDLLVGGVKSLSDITNDQKGKLQELHKAIIDFTETVAQKINPHLFDKDTQQKALNAIKGIKDIVVDRTGAALPYAQQSQKGGGRRDV